MKAVAVLRLACALTALACACAQRRAPATPPVLGARPRVQFCTEWESLKTGPLCLREVSAEQQRHRHDTERFEFEGPRVIHMVNINGHGEPVPNDNGAVELRLHYANDRFVEGTVYDLNGLIVERDLYGDDDRSRWLDEWNRPHFGTTSAATGYQVLSRDGQGLVSAYRPLGPDGEPAQGNGGANEWRVERDARGMRRANCAFDREGRPMLTRHRIHCWRDERNSAGEIVERRGFDTRGQPTTDDEGVHRIHFEFDASGNEVGKSYFDLENRPVQRRESGCFVLKKYFDDHGFLRGADCLDAGGKPIPWAEGHASWRATPDTRGRQIEIAYFDASGQAFDRDDCARVQLELDERGRTLSRTCVSTGAREPRGKNPAITRYKYDERGLEIGEAYFDGNGAPSIWHGCAGLGFEYNAFRQVSLRSAWDEHGKLTAGRDGAALTRYTYDARGQLSEESFFDAAQQPVNGESGYARRLFEYDAQGTEVQQRLFTAAGLPLTLPRLRALIVRSEFANGAAGGITRAAAIRRIEAAQQALAAGMSFDEALYRYSSETPNFRNPGWLPPLDPARFYRTVRPSLRGLEVGKVSEIAEYPYGFTIYQRIQ